MFSRTVVAIPPHSSVFFASDPGLCHNDGVVLSVQLSSFEPDCFHPGVARIETRLPSPHAHHEMVIRLYCDWGDRPRDSFGRTLEAETRPYRKGERILPACPGAEVGRYTTGTTFARMVGERCSAHDA